MEKKYCRKHIGKVYLTNEGYEAKVIDGGSKLNYCTIRIEDYTTEAIYTHIRKGKIKYPFHPSLFGKGYIGVGKYSWKMHRDLYNAWWRMVQRCYDSKCHERSPTYKDAIVCNEWLNFQNFAEWYERNFAEGFELDKDLLVPGNKTYGPEVCLLIPRKLNSFLANSCSTNTSGYTGVSWHKASNKWAAAIHANGKNKALGYFTDKEEASNAYKEARQEQAAVMRELYKNILPENALNLIR